MSAALGPFELGSAPLLTATIQLRAGNVGISTACRWTIRTPSHVETVVSSPDASITNPSDNVWTYQMETIEEDGVYWVRCESTAGVVAAKAADLAVTESVFD